MKKVLFFSIISLMAMATVGSMASCDDEEASINNNDNGHGGNITPDGYVDLGLPSGTKWKTTNESKMGDTYNFYTFQEAVSAFGDNLPTKEQFEELIASCDFVWDTVRKGVNFISTANGNSIFMPALGIRSCEGEVEHVGERGFYWSSTSKDADYSVNLLFRTTDAYMYNNYPCKGQSVRLVHN